MRTRLTGLVLLLALLVVPAVATVPAAIAAPASSGDTLVLATEAGEPAPGLDPRTAQDPDNEFAPDDYERPWTWWLGVVILASTVPVIALLGLLYYVLVHRPRQHARSSGSRPAAARR